MRRAAALLLLLAVTPAQVAAQTPAQAPAQAQDTLARLRSDLLSQNSATRTLANWCADLKLATPPVIHAAREPVTVPASDETRTLLGAAPGEAIGYRRVRLMCGRHVLSEADNWYRPGQLTPDMNRTLDTTDTPFGTVVRPLDFTRTTLDAAPPPGGSAVLRVRAVLKTANGTPFSLVVENYSPELVARPSPQP